MAESMEQSIARAALNPAVTANSYRSIWISDVHLGTRGCKAEALLDFLQRHQAENLYLVGDIVDGWNLGPAWYWSRAQSAVASEIRAWRRRGVKVVFLPGNHDQLNLDLIETLFGAIHTKNQLIHRTAEGRLMLVLHGHQFDESYNASRWPSMMGSRAYTVALKINEWYARERLKRGARARWFKNRVSSMVRFLTEFDRHEFDRTVFETARENKVDGVICGHIHRPEQRLLDQIWYINDGDWVESCTALVEDHEGTLKLLLWGLKQARASEAGHIVPAYAS
ncbi:MAG TPA: UDP-2,3-diacylglucosamine diphosphatase [Candidatus Binataceae bacterium]|jgi:UDP-2,3-diacylglucosamine pyrophosphatase LpxH|nr:UDP-2,3-diacylglucosamine diphosphatase [Candidatus Binataceae bacterium]